MIALKFLMVFTKRWNWKTGDKVLIYSNTKCKWMDGKIYKIYTDDEGEWLCVEYGRSRDKKEVQRFCADIKPKT